MAKFTFYETELNEQLNSSYFDGFTVLDVGTRNGFNPITMVRKGATHVYGIDPDDSRFEEIAPFLEREKITLIKTTLQEYTPDILFDIITIFLWNIPIAEYDEVAAKMKLLLKPGGRILVGIVDDEYKKYESNVSVERLFKKYFSVVRVIDPDRYQCILEVSHPRARGGGKRTLKKSRRKQKKRSFKTRNV